jgi:hypothetical protein
MVKHPLVEPKRRFGVVTVYLVDGTSIPVRGADSAELGYLPGMSEASTHAVGLLCTANGGKIVAAFRFDHMAGFVVGSNE